MKLKNTAVGFDLPPWIVNFLHDYNSHLDTLEERMELAIQLSGQNVVEKTGGPFGALVFDRNSKKLISIGVNLVLSTQCCVNHAEMVAIMLAQRIMGQYSFSQNPIHSMELITSAEPCAMCLGAIVWAGFSHVACGARDQDVRAIGFDEGPKPENWKIALEDRGTAVTTDVRRNEAVSVLNSYSNSGGILYNGKSSSEANG